MSTTQSTDCRGQQAVCCSDADKRMLAVGSTQRNAICTGSTFLDITEKRECFFCGRKKLHNLNLVIFRLSGGYGHQIMEIHSALVYKALNIGIKRIGGVHVLVLGSLVLSSIVKYAQLWFGT